jgi:hypothetical protein
VKASVEYKALLLKLKDQIRERGSHEQLMAYGFLRDRTRRRVCDAERYRRETYGVQANYEGVQERAALGIARVIETLGLTPNLVDILDWVKHGDLTSRQIQSPAMTALRSAQLEWDIEHSMRHGAGVRWHLAKASLFAARTRATLTGDESLIAGAEHAVTQARLAYDKQDQRIAQAQRRYQSCRDTVKSL